MNLFLDPIHSVFAVVNTGQLVGGAVQVLAVVVVCFLVLVLATSFIRYQVLMRNMSESSPEDVDPTDRFKMAVMERMGSAHRTPDPFAVCLFRIRDREKLTDPARPESLPHLLQGVRKKLEANMRGKDVVCLIEDRVFGVVVDLPRNRAEDFAARVIKALYLSPVSLLDGRLQPVQLEVGIATYPDNGDRVQPLKEVSEAALAETSETYQVVLAPLPEGVPEPIEEEHHPAPAGLLDPLTGVLRHERLNGALQKYVSKFRKSAKPVSVVVIDIDRLDRYNDHYGRGAGDAILKAVGGLLERAVREDDVIGRFRDDEFVVCLAGGCKRAMTTAVRLAGEIKQMSVDFEGAKLKITASLGVAGHPQHGNVPRDLLEGAFLAVEAAKENGKGQCMLFNPKTMTKAKHEGPFESF